jgi:hypothetical protein
MPPAGLIVWANKRLDDNQLLMAGSGDGNHRNRRHIADGHTADVNVGYEASRLDNAMSAVSLKAPHLRNLQIAQNFSNDLPESGHQP